MCSLELATCMRGMRLDSAKWRTGPQRGNLHKRGRCRKIKRSKPKRPSCPIRHLCFHLFLTAFEVFGQRQSFQQEQTKDHSYALTYSCDMTSDRKPTIALCWGCVRAYLKTQKTHMKTNAHTVWKNVMIPAHSRWSLEVCSVFYLCLWDLTSTSSTLRKGPFHSFMHNLIQLLRIMYILIQNTVNLLFKSSLVKVCFNARHHIIKYIYLFFNMHLHVDQDLLQTCNHM